LKQRARLFGSWRYWRNWTGVGLVLWLIFLFNDILANIPFSLLVLLTLALSCAYLWGAVTPLIRMGVRRWPLENNFNWARLLLHFCFSVVFSIAMTAVLTYLYLVIHWFWFDRLFGLKRTFAGMAYYLFLVKVVFYWTVVAVDSAIHYFRRYQAESEQATLLERQLGEARLKVLRAQLQPHFLFNTLHSLAAFIRMNETDEALEMLVDLGDLLRASLEGGSGQWVPLSEELFLVEKYLNIERRRLQGRAHLVMEVDEGLEDQAVPQMLLQPLVENSIRHGLEKHAHADWVRLRIRDQGTAMAIVIEDNGPGFPDDWAPSEAGTGLGHTLGRIKGLYGGCAKVVIGNRDEGGAMVAVHLPKEKAAVE